MVRLSGIRQSTSCLQFHVKQNPTREVFQQGTGRAAGSSDLDKRSRAWVKRSANTYLPREAFVSGHCPHKGSYER